METPHATIAANPANPLKEDHIMKAAFFRKHGGPEVMEYGDMPDPMAGAGQVLVDVYAASVNGADWKVRAGSYAPLEHLPYIPGRDFSGVVCALGAGVTDFKVGDEVFGVCDVGQEQAYAEKIAIKASIIARKPAAITHVEAAALSLIGLTALVSVEDTLKLKSGETILIQGGAGGVASYAVQLAKHLGARVITTASKANHDYVQRLGADEVIDYNAVDFTKVVSDCDAAFETVGGGDLVQRTFSVLKPGGRAAFIGSGQTAPAADRADVVSLRPKVGRTRGHMARVADLALRGAVNPPEIRLFSLQEAAAAHKISEGRHFRGKLVFKLK
jgi:NADPH:quinone reductase-like Zn-dependent oxidoreductase